MTRALRLCVSVAELAELQFDPVEGSQRRKCELCGCEVWYDPRATMPFLGPEFIVCGQCFEDRYRELV